jgi:hypothetical protein
LSSREEHSDDAIPTGFCEALHTLAAADVEIFRC